jgi:hypothetical protein
MHEHFSNGTRNIKLKIKMLSASPIESSHAYLLKHVSDLEGIGLLLL